MMVHGLLCFLVTLAMTGTCIGDDPAAGKCLIQRKTSVSQQSEHAIDEAVGHLSTTGSEEAAQTLGRSQAADARFLMQATFGPTWDSLKQLGQEASYEAWIAAQMKLPVGSHRALFRARANPPFDPTGQPGFQARSPCDQGSRWHGFALTLADVGKRVAVRGGQILVEGDHRTDIDPSATGAACTDVPREVWRKRQETCKDKMQYLKYNCRHGSSEWTESKLCQQSCYDMGVGYAGDDCSGGWAKYLNKNFMAYICGLEEVDNGLVSLSSSQSCGTLTYMQNPAIWLAGPVRNLETQLPFDSNPLLPGLIFLAENFSSCDLGDRELVRSGGRLYRHDPRMKLAENTLERPGAGGCVARTFLNEQSCRLQPEGAQGCRELCGSPGEVANDPRRGHQLPISTRERSPPDSSLDNRYRGRLHPSLAKSTVWTMAVLQAEDQLRQRMAWALSQIFVVSVLGGNARAFSEMWVNFYDIFVRNSFGNLRDILREVTYSPLMGDYLTFKRSKSYDTSRTYPDENFAREIMQLFTVGLYKLHPNGSTALDANGEQVATYDNENIMSFARVFTGFFGQPIRGNIEVILPSTENMIDPMRMEAKYHDIYPKPDLDGNYLGDRYPLCADVPQHAFLDTGARYEFLGYDHAGEASPLSKASELFDALCREAGGACAFAPAVTLSRTLKCHGDECELDALGVVQVGAGFYEYVPPPCVHLFFFNGRSAALGTNSRVTKCADPDTPVAGASCCAGCTDQENGWMTSVGHKCATANGTWVSGGQPRMTAAYCNKNSWWRTKGYCRRSCWEQGAGYEGDDCSQGAFRTRQFCSSLGHRSRLRVAEARCAGAGMAVCPQETSSTCMPYIWTPAVCNATVRVHGDGKVSGHTRWPEQNGFAVTWTGGGQPAEGEYEARVEVRAVFQQVPTKEALLGRLKIGALAPKGGCTGRGEVKVCGRSGAMDSSTIFECDGRFFKNSESLVHVNGHSFRNPPAFARPGPFPLEGKALQQAALAEVESLLDHLVGHPNTPVFIVKKLIQRFATSNPSPAYIAAAAEAFRTGAYDGTTYSGQRGDLAATLAAVLLHPEAREQTDRADGLLREPILKLVHFMRSMEYVDAEQQEVVLKLLDSLIGQFPYFSPSVFNFYDAKYQPSGFQKMEPEPEPEGEPEPEQEPEPEPEPEPLVAPEFQIFTPPLAMNLLNGLSSLIQDGVSPCEGGLGVRDINGGCKRGSLGLDPAKTTGDALGQLDLLLTGGRLTPVDAGIVRAAYEGAADGKGLQAAQEAIVLTPEFHNLGDPKPEGSLRPPKAPVPPHQVRDYKATVLLFMGGGADTFNLLVPVGCHLYDEYRQVRQGAALGQEELESISTSGQACSNFGVHPALPLVAELYRKGQAAFVSNVGALVEPLTREQLGAGSAHSTQKCPGLFSHVDQQAAAQTLQCQGTGGAPRGVGGRISDQLAAQGFKVESFSMAGSATWSEGDDTHTEVIDRGQGAVRFSKYELWKDAISNITRQRYGNVYCEEYAQAFGDAIESSEKQGRILEGVKLQTDYKPNSGLSQQLHQVARLIAARKHRQAERDLFFVQLGGFDTHSNLAQLLASKFAEMNEALMAFVAELQAQGSFDATTVVTASDFGRTLTYNGQGTDHGWGGNHLMIGGSLRGGTVFNEFPATFTEGNAYDAGRGRVIPKFPWESMMVPIAEWMGVGGDELQQVFPNLGNFNRSMHIISTNALFKP